MSHGLNRRYTNQYIGQNNMVGDRLQKLCNAYFMRALESNDLASTVGRPESYAG